MFLAFGYLAQLAACTKKGICPSYVVIPILHFTAAKLGYTACKVY